MEGMNRLEGGWRLKPGHMLPAMLLLLLL